MFNSGCFTLLRIYINHSTFQVSLLCLSHSYLFPCDSNSLTFLEVISLLLISYNGTNNLFVLSNWVSIFLVTCTSFTAFSPFPFTYFLTDSLRDYNHICVVWLCQLQLDRYSNWRNGSSCTITKTRHGHCCTSCTGCRYSCLLHDCLHCR